MPEYCILIRFQKLQDLFTNLVPYQITRPLKFQRFLFSTSSILFLLKSSLPPTSTQLTIFLLFSDPYRYFLEKIKISKFKKKKNQKTHK